VDQMCFNTGQTCLQWSRLLVPVDRHDEAVTLAVDAAARYRVGDPTDPATDLGPLVSAAALERVRGYIQRGITEGAHLATGGLDRPAGLDRGYYVQPTVFGSVDDSSTIATQEIFGPGWFQAVRHRSGVWNRRAGQLLRDQIAPATARAERADRTTTTRRYVRA
jgi:aldehyde dehydrogenase (NAD+)